MERNGVEWPRESRWPTSWTAAAARSQQSKHFVISTTYATQTRSIENVPVIMSATGKSPRVSITVVTPARGETCLLMRFFGHEHWKHTSPIKLSMTSTNSVNESFPSLSMSYPCSMK